MNSSTTLISWEEIDAIQSKLCREWTGYERAVMRILRAVSPGRMALEVMDDARGQIVAARVERLCLEKHYWASEGIKAEYRRSIEMYEQSARDLLAAVHATKPHMLEAYKDLLAESVG